MNNTQSGSQTAPLFYRDNLKNSQRILLFLHGNLITSLYWEPLVNELEKLDDQLRLVRVDLRGFGRSQPALGFDTVNQFALDVKQFITDVLEVAESEIKQKITLVGWSFGALVAMELCSTWPTIFGKLIMPSVGPVTGVPVMRDNDLGQPTYERCTTKEEVANTKRIVMTNSLIVDKNVEMLETIFKMVLFNSGKIPPNLDELLQETLMQTNYLDTVWAISEFDISGGKGDKAKYIQGPVLIVHGKKDLVIDVIHATGLVEEIGPDKCKIVLLENLGHMVPLEDPAFLAQEIVQFLAAQ